MVMGLPFVMSAVFLLAKSSPSYPYPTKWVGTTCFSSRCDKYSAIILAGRQPDVNSP
jgi:hypothetical protein